MKYFMIIFSFIIFVFSIALIIKIIFNLVIKKKSQSVHILTRQSSFAGFIQTKNGLIRACEFSTNGTILSCSKWFDENFSKARSK